MDELYEEVLSDPALIDDFSIEELMEPFAVTKEEYTLNKNIFLALGGVATLGLVGYYLLKGRAIVL